MSQACSLVHDLNRQRQNKDTRKLFSSITFYNLSVLLGMIRDLTGISFLHNRVWLLSSHTFAFLPIFWTFNIASKRLTSVFGKSHSFLRIRICLGLLVREHNRAANVTPHVQRIEKAEA